MISVVYSCYMINDWKKRASKQIKRLKTSGLYDAADEIYFIGTDIYNTQEKDVRKILLEYPKIKVDIHNRNMYEAHALEKVDRLSRIAENNKKILYFHSKGVFNKFKNFSTQEIDPLKIEAVDNWKEIMEYFLIDNWKNCVQKLDEVDTVGATIYAYWYWGNFWWANSDYIKKNIPLSDYFGGSRWQCESWLHESNPDKEKIKYYEHYHFTYNPFYTYIPKIVYNNQKKNNLSFFIINAKYGYFAHQIDEGRGLEVLEDKCIDVTDIAIKINKERTSNKNIHLFPEELINEDPAPGLQKALRVSFKINNSPKEYIITSYFSNPIKLL